jgi:hypothetical protein
MSRLLASLILMNENPRTPGASGVPLKKTPGLIWISNGSMLTTNELRTIFLDKLDTYCQLLLGGKYVFRGNKE